VSVDFHLISALPFELQAEISENVFRKDFTPSEIGAIFRRCKSLLKVQAKKNQAGAGPSSGRGAKRSGAGNFPEPVRGQVRDKIGAIAGVSGRTVAKIVAVCEAAEKDPERFGKLKDDMDRTGCVDGPHKRLQVILKADDIKREPPPLPGNGPYRVIVADPPWQYEKRNADPSQRGGLPYPPMSIEQMCALPVVSIAHHDCVLWLWTTNAHLITGDALTVLNAWCFEPKTVLTWVKDRMGTGDWLRGQSEHCLMAVRGRPIVHLTNQSTILHGAVRAHSQKPEEFYQFVEALCPAPRYCELFSRGQREKWDGHGDEVGECAVLRADGVDLGEMEVPS
jgi:N6-adenosine-specific RNA methylase IME4